MKKLLSFLQYPIVKIVHALAFVLIFYITTFDPPWIETVKTTNFLLGFIAFESFLMFNSYLHQIYETVISKKAITTDDFFEKDLESLDDKIRSADNNIFIGGFFISSATTSSELQKKIRDGKKVRLLLCKEDGDCIDASAKLLGRSAKSFLAKLESTLKTFEDLYGNGIPDNLEIKQIDYTFSFIFTAVDIDKSNGFIHIQHCMYKNRDVEKVCFTCKNGEKWFKFYCSQIEMLWKDASALDLGISLEKNL